MGAQCPPGLQPEKCTCVHNNCAGARFDGDTCVTTTGEVGSLMQLNDDTCVTTTGEVGSLMQLNGDTCETKYFYIFRGW